MPSAAWSDISIIPSLNLPHAVKLPTLIRPLWILTRSFSDNWGKFSFNQLSSFSKLIFWRFSSEDNLYLSISLPHSSFLERSGLTMFFPLRCWASLELGFNNLPLFLGFWGTSSTFLGAELSSKDFSTGSVTGSAILGSVTFTFLVGSTLVSIGAVSSKVTKLLL